MTNAEPPSTDSTTERAEKVEGQPTLIAVSEENLAALLRATRGADAPEVQQPAAPAVTEVSEAAAVTESIAATPTAEPIAVTPAAAPVEQVVERAIEPRVELRREKRAEQRDYPAASLPAEAAPIQVTLPKSQSAIASAPIAMPAPSPSTSRSVLLVGGIGGVVILAVGIFLLWPKGHAAKPAPVTVVAPKDIAPLQVLAEPLGNGLINVRWNAQGPLITQARDGRLVITEHDKAPRTMALDAGQIKIGHLTYQSTAESIEFDLEVNDRSGGVTRESILAVVPPANTAPQAAHEQIPVIKTQVIPPPAAPKVQAPAVVEVAPASPVKARAFVPPPTQAKNVQGAIIDAPPALANAPATPVGVNLPAALGPVSAPPAAAQQQVRVESNLQAANLIKKVVPVYPLLAKSAGVEGVVKFTALIGKDGKIQNLKVISGPAPLVDAASEAVKRWVYKPTLLNGRPLEVITEINVNFTISGATR